MKTCSKLIFDYKRLMSQNKFLFSAKTKHPSLMKYSEENTNSSINKTYSLDEIKKQIPFSKLEYNFSKSSGPGGQNVNKLNTKVEIRFNLSEANWITNENKEKIRKVYSNKINQKDEFILTAQESRDQLQNKFAVEEKLASMIYEIQATQKERNFKQLGETDEKKDYRIKMKKQKSDKLKMRKNLDF